jgi:hypothetical protein
MLDLALMETYPVVVVFTTTDTVYSGNCSLYYSSSGSFMILSRYFFPIINVILICNHQPAIPVSFTALAQTFRIALNTAFYIFSFSDNDFACCNVSVLSTHIGCCSTICLKLLLNAGFVQ